PKGGQKTDAAKADEHRPAGPQAAARPAGKTPLPPPGSGPKRTADGKPVAGAKPGPKPFVVKPNMGKPPTSPPAAEPTVAKKPASRKPAAHEASGTKASAGKAAASKSPKKPTAPAKPGAKKHSTQLAKRKPR
ncbi:MAG: transcriptional regulator, partial [Planctomycetia bacterium]